MLLRRSGKRLPRSTSAEWRRGEQALASHRAHIGLDGVHVHVALQDRVLLSLRLDDVVAALHRDLHLEPRLQALEIGPALASGDTVVLKPPEWAPLTASWGVENRTVALRVPGGSAKARHFEHRVAGVDANPYLVAAVTLGGALDGIAAKADPGPPVTGVASEAGHVPDLPRSWQEAIERFERSEFCHRVLGAAMHRGFAAVKRAEHQRLALTVTEAEWEMYGFVV